MKLKDLKIGRLEDWKKKKKKERKKEKHDDDWFSFFRISSDSFDIENNTHELTNLNNKHSRGGWIRDMIRSIHRSFEKGVETKRSERLAVKYRKEEKS